MGAPRFVSPGGMAQNAIEQFFIQRELENRQRMMDAQRMKEGDTALRQRDEEMALRRQEEERLKAERATGQANLEEEREFRRASTLATNMMPGILDADTAGVLRKHGYGSIVSEGDPTQGASLGVDAGGVDQYAVTPGLLQTKGGTAYQQARAAEAARAEQAAAAQAAAAERAAADRASRESLAAESNATREQIAGLAAGARGDSAALRDEMMRDRIERERREDKAKQTEQERNAKAFKDTAQTTLSLIDRLEKHPGVSRITGNMEMLGWTQAAKDAAAIREQLVAALTLPNLGTLKGPMSDKDVAFVKSLATRLSAPGISEQEFRTAITEAKTRLSGASAGGPAAPGRKRYDLNGNLIP